jgi:hypothetical protein
MAVLTPSEDLALATTLTTSAYHTLVYNIFPPPRSGSAGNSVVVAFTSVNSGEGVTHVVGSLFHAMRGAAQTSALRVDVAWLKEQPIKTSPAAPSEPQDRLGWGSGWESRKQLLQQLRARSQYVVIDCPALSASSDCISIAPLVDGIVLVVEADRTRKAQIRNATCRIEAAGGKILGLVLNKRRYPVPDSIYKVL